MNLLAANNMRISEAKRRHCECRMNTGSTLAAPPSANHFRGPDHLLGSCGGKVTAPLHIIARIFFNCDYVFKFTVLPEYRVRRVRCFQRLHVCEMVALERARSQSSVKALRMVLGARVCRLLPGLGII